MGILYIVLAMNKLRSVDKISFLFSELYHSQVLQRVVHTQVTMNIL